jgi:DNA replication protein DnaC
MRYKQAEFQNLPEDLKALVKKSITEEKGLFIYGNTGVGKTYFLHGLAKPKNAQVRNFTELLVEFRDAMNKGHYFDSIKDLTQEDYLFIDDIGAEKLSDFVVEFLYLIVNKRYENMKRTVFATNLTVEDFIEKYGERIMSRISEMCILHELKGEDKRI